MKCTNIIFYQKEGVFVFIKISNKNTQVYKVTGVGKYIKQSGSNYRIDDEDIDGLVRSFLYTSGKYWKLEMALNHEYLRHLNRDVILNDILND